MTEPRSVKAVGDRPRIVAVISSAENLVQATRLRRLPNLFELRLDAFCAPNFDLKSITARLRAPLIVTARAPSEGELNNLNVARRQSLLLNALPHATYVDVELRCVEELSAVLVAAKERGTGRIISVHKLQSAPPVTTLEQLLEKAHTAGADIFKVATRTDTPAELDRLLKFFHVAKMLMPVSAMGIGKLGSLSRKLLYRDGSVLNYVHLGTTRAEGQLSLSQMRRVSERGAPKRG